MLVRATGGGAMAVTGFVLVNADTDEDLGPLPNGATIRLSALPARNLNVRANTSPSTVGSVRFSYDGTSNFRTENAAPHALAGDTSGDYYPWTPAVGSHGLGAAPYSQSGGGGVAGEPLSITFTVVEQGPGPTAARSAGEGRLPPRLPDPAPGRRSRR